ncbi:MAG: hypothetical protein GVY13_07995 [Alphaproteobacteria bacterium]|nr:hypothetical protein [Alphaproteobacteria bacterium]
MPAASDGAITGPAALLAIAKAYPFDIRSEPFLFVDGRVEPLERFDPDGRTPVLAVGSNRAPAQLARKFAALGPGTVIPVTGGRLAGFDVVYSSHFSRYGAVPARLWPVPGVTVAVGVSWLTPAQLQRMHETEGAANYRYAALTGIVLDDEAAGRLDRVMAYLGLRPPFAPGGAPVPLAAIPATGRPAPGLDQPAALAAARDRLAPGAPLDPFILQTIACPVTRAQRSDRLSGRFGLPVEGSAASTARS